MYTCVGSTCRHNLDPASAGDPGQCGFEFSLDRPSVRLNLKPGKVRAVVFNRCAVAHRDTLSSIQFVTDWLGHFCFGPASH
jgi:hypothetical protein